MPQKGLTVTQGIECANCGTEADPGARYCALCGQSLNSDTPLIAVPPTARPRKDGLPRAARWGLYAIVGLFALIGLNSVLTGGGSRQASGPALERATAAAAPSTPDATGADAQARRQAVVLAATVNALPPRGAPSATPTLTGQADLATVVAAATEIARLRALPPDPTPPPTPVLPLVVPATDQAPSYRIVTWRRSAADPRIARYLVETVVPDSYVREDVLAVLVAATRLTFRSETGPKTVQIGLRHLRSSERQFPYDAMAKTASAGLDFPGLVSPDNGKIHAGYFSANDSQPGDTEMDLDL